MAAGRGQRPQLCEAGLAVLTHTPADNCIAAARNRRIHRMRTGFDIPLSQGQIAFCSRCGQQRRGKRVLCQQHQPACVFIQPVHRAKHAGAALPGKAVQPPVRKRGVRIIESGVHGKTGGLIYHSGEVILIHRLKLDRLGFNRSGRLRRQCKGNALPGMNRLVGVQGASSAKKPLPWCLTALMQEALTPPRAQKHAKALAVCRRRHREAQPRQNAHPFPTHIRLLL